MSKNNNGNRNDAVNSNTNNNVTEKNQGNVLENIDNVVSNIVAGNEADNRVGTRKVSEVLRETVQMGQPVADANSLIDDAMAQLIGRVTVVSEDAVSETEDGVPTALNITEKSAYWDTSMQTNVDFGTATGNVGETGNVPTRENVELLDKLNNLGLLKTIQKLAATSNLSSADIEQASVTMHMLINGLTKEQAQVVNKFYNEDVDIMKYVDNKFSATQLFYIGSELKEGHDVTEICKTNKYTVSQMLEIQTSVHANLDISYADASMSPAVLGVLRKATICGIDISEIAEAAKNLNAMQVEMLVNLKYFGIDISNILKQKSELDADKLFATLQAYYEKRNALKCELSQDNTSIVQVQG